MNNAKRAERATVPLFTYTVALAAAVIPALFSAGCGAFNPAFVNVATGGTGGFTTIPNPPGHVVVAFVNNTQFDERLIGYLAPQLDLTEDEIRLLTPRVRGRLRVTFADGTFVTVEMVSGSKSFIEPGFDANAFPDLNQNDLTNLVVQCDVASVTLEPGAFVEVFIPVELTGFELLENTADAGNPTFMFEPRQTIAPQFRVLQTDDVDADGNVILRRNVGTRDRVHPTRDVICGGVIEITIQGSLSVPFLDGASTAPTVDIENEPQVAGIGGRFSFRTTVQ